MNIVDSAGVLLGNALGNNSALVLIIGMAFYLAAHRRADQYRKHDHELTA